MIAQSRQLLRGEAALVPVAPGPATASAAPVASSAAPMAASPPLSPLGLAFGFFCFLPYPALSIGNNSALQAGNVLSVLACLPLLTLPPATWMRRGYWVAPLLTIPLVTSLLRVVLLGGYAPSELAFKALLAWSLSFVTLPATQVLAPARSLSILTGIAVAAVLHVAVGFYQWYCFTTVQVFPLAELYANPSFLSVQANAERIARYTQRPFGIFPEPSAMAASLAPFVLLWTAEICGILRFKQTPRRWQRALFGIASAGAVALIILSQSGHTGVTLAGLLVIAVIWVSRSRATLRTYLTVVLAIGVVLPTVLWFAAMSLSTRVGGNSEVGNSSWEERSQSLVLGMRLMADGKWSTALLGVGIGMSAPALHDGARIEAVFSIVLPYVYETGLVGAVAALIAGAYLLRRCKSVQFDPVSAVILLVWLAGVTVTTSYHQLLPLWIAMGWLTTWPQLCRYVPRHEAVSPGAGGARPQALHASSNVRPLHAVGHPGGRTASTGRRS